MALSAALVNNIFFFVRIYFEKKSNDGNYVAKESKHKIWCNRP